jgi:hypothetical protein
MQSFGYVSGQKNNSFNVIKVFKTKVTQSQRNGKDNAKMKYCRLGAGRTLTTGSILKEQCHHLRITNLKTSA